VARQPAVQLSVKALVASDTKLHFEFHRNQAVILLHIPVTFDTIDPHLKVWPVIEFHMVRNIIDPHPGYGGFRLQMPPLLYDLGMLGNDVLVAEKTFAHLRNPGVMRALPVRVTEPAVDFLYPGVNSMAEINGLPGPDLAFRIKIVEIEHRCEQN